jgi:hypothetical protein
MANKANWQDTIYDINTRRAEEGLRQSQTQFDLALPGAQFGQEESYKAGLGNRAGQEFQTGVLTEAGKLPADQRAQFISDSAIRQLQNLDPTSPGAAQTRRSIEDFLKVQGAGLLKTNPEAAAAMFGAMTMGQSTADAARQIAMLSDPKTAFDPINLASMANQMGGQYDQATNSVRLGGSGGTMPVEKFVGMMRQRALDQTADMTPGMERASNDAKLSAFGDQTVEMYRQNGILAVKNPVTNQVIPLLNLQTGQQIQQPLGGQFSAFDAATEMGGARPLYAQMPAVTANPQIAQMPAPPLYAQQPAPVGGAAMSAAPAGGAAFNPQVVAQSLDQAKATRLGIEDALRTLNRQQPGQITPAVQYYQQELAKAQQVEAQARAKSEADALARYQQTLQQQGYTPGRPFTPWLTR